MLNKKDQERFKDEIGFVPPGVVLADHFGPELQEIIASYHHQIWEGGVIPLKYRYLIALATAIFDDNEKRARLELTKAIKEGATKEEVLEVIKQQIWMKGAPTLVQVAPLLEMLSKKFPEE